MEDKIKIIYYRDCGLIITFIILLWVVLVDAMSVVSSLVTVPGMRFLILSIGLITDVFVTTTLIAILWNLKKKENKYILKRFYLTYWKSILFCRLLLTGEADLHGKVLNLGILKPFSRKVQNA